MNGMSLATGPTGISSLPPAITVNNPSDLYHASSDYVQQWRRWACQVRVPGLELTQLSVSHHLLRHTPRQNVGGHLLTCINNGLQSAASFVPPCCHSAGYSVDNLYLIVLYMYMQVTDPSLYVVALFEAVNNL